jgi:hypothetical protein
VIRHADQKGVSQLNKRTPRTTGQGRGGVTTVQVNSNNFGDSTSQIRLQWLRARAAVSPLLATTIAHLVWEVRHG